MLFSFDDDGHLLYSLTHTPSFFPWVLPWDTGKVDFDIDSGALIAHLDNDQVMNGTIDLATCSKITWKSGSIWIKVPDTKNVHVVFMNHLDVGYDGLNPLTGFVNNVLNTYFTKYFPRAIKFAYLMNDVDPDSGFIYTTHPWLLILYLNCPANFTLSGVDLHCPSKDEVDLMIDALKKGYIACHAGPMNMQIEFMNSFVFQMIFDMIADFNKEYQCYSQVLSQRDVPGMTAAVIPVLLRNNIKAVSVGVNPFSAPPAVPKLFQWKAHNESKDVILAMWHAGGYPDNPGTTLYTPGGISIMDSTIAVRDGEVLVFAFRSDNSGPPESISEIQTVFDIIHDEYPQAKVFASTLDNFVNSINVSALPTVCGEIGDTWIQGVASDPRKTALYRAISRALRCNQDSKYSCDKEQAEFALYLSKIPEHTWGLDSVHDTTNWNNNDFNKAKNELISFEKIISSWIEQRSFFNITQNIIESMPDSDIHRFFKKELDGIFPILPNLDDFMGMDASAMFKIESKNCTIGFGVDGSVTHFNVTYNNHVYSFADKFHPLGLFSYHTYNETDFQAMESEYDYSPMYNPGYDKPDSTQYANPQTNVYYFPMTGLYRNVKDDSIFLVELEGDFIANIYYGGPEKVWIQVQVLSKDPATSDGVMIDLSFEVILENKTATRLAEATMFSFTPSLQDPIGGSWKDRLYKVVPRFAREFSSDAFVTLSLVNKNGSFYQHSVEQVNLVEQGKLENITLALFSPDVPLVCPIYREFDYIKTPTPFPFLTHPPPGIPLDGFAFNIHNNIWNTNYPLWYPFTDLEEDRNFKARFHMLWYQNFT